MKQANVIWKWNGKTLIKCIIKASTEQIVLKPKENDVLNMTLLLILNILNGDLKIKT